MARDFSGAGHLFTAEYSGTDLAGSDLTMSCWANADANQTNKGIMGKWVVGPLDGYVMWVNFSTNNIVNFQKDAESPSGGTNSTTALTNGTWNQLIGTATGDATPAYEFFFDGTSEDTETAGTDTDNNQAVELGTYSGQSSRRFDGQLAECVIWNIILPDDSIQAIARGAQPWVVATSSQVVFCQIEGNDDPEPNFASSTNTFELAGTGAKSTPNPPVEMIENFL